VGAAKDGNGTNYRPQAAVAGQYDAMDDATDVCLLHFILSQWAGSFLGNIKCYQDWSPIFCNRLG